MIKLHPKEFELMAYLLTGMSQNEIAKKQGITPKGVKYHCTNIFKKYSVQNRIQLMALFIDQELSKDFKQFLKTKENLEKIANFT